MGQKPTKQSPLFYMVTEVSQTKSDKTGKEQPDVLRFNKLIVTTGTSVFITHHFVLSVIA